MYISVDSLYFCSDFMPISGENTFYFKDRSSLNKYRVESIIIITIIQQIVHEVHIIYTYSKTRHMKKKDTKMK